MKPMAVCCSHNLNVVLVTANSEKAVLDSICSLDREAMHYGLVSQRYTGRERE